jgi:hypothetical protein
VGVRHRFAQDRIKSRTFWNEMERSEMS